MNAICSQPQALKQLMLFSNVCVQQTWPYLVTVLQQHLGNASHSYDITKVTPASFEPTIDYVVTKIPRFAFEKFPQADPTLTTQMKSVGEAMAIGRTFKESLQKCLRSLEIGRSGLGGDGKPWRIGTEVYGDRDILPRDVISRKLSVPNAERIFFIRHALRAGFSIEEIFNLTKIDRWFLVQIKEIVDFEEELAGAKN